MRRSPPARILAVAGRSSTIFSIRLRCGPEMMVPIVEAGFIASEIEENEVKTRELGAEGRAYDLPSSS